MKSSESRHAAQFNLVELVVIITIVISITAVLVPVIYRGSMQAKSLLCSSNLSRLGVWSSMYCSGSNNFLPAYEDGWVALIAANGEVVVDPAAEPVDDFACPSQPFVALAKGYTPAEYWRGTNYGINQHIASRLTGPYDRPLPQWSQMNIRQIKDPSSKLLIADASGSNTFEIAERDPAVAGISRYGRTFADGLPPNPAPPFPFLRHIDYSGNFLFIDGHVDPKKSWPEFMLGSGTSGYAFWHAEHRYPGCGY